MKEMGCMFEYVYNYRRYVEKMFYNKGSSAISDEILMNMKELLRISIIFEIYPESWKIK